jgi:hypothetical protein
MENNDEEFTIEDFNIDELKDELLKIYDELLCRGLKHNEINKLLLHGRRYCV